MTGDTPAIDPEMAASRPWAFEPMGLTAENVARDFNVTRREQDEFAALSQEKALGAIKEGRFIEQIVPLSITRQRPGKNGRFELYQEIFDQDECPRPGTTVEALSKLRPAFAARGTVTAGNSCQMSDGAAAVVCMSRKKADDLGLRPLAGFRSYAVAGVDPRYMGIGPIKAIPKALGLAKADLSRVGLIELNEAFASQAVYCIRELKLDQAITNVNGGAIALGHPLGATGVIMTVKLLYEMQRRADKNSLGLVSMCVGMGMGAAGVFAQE
jgi:acetyl-CoA acyltransferase